MQKLGCGAGIAKLGWTGMLVMQDQEAAAAQALQALRAWVSFTRRAPCFLFERDRRSIRNRDLRFRRPAHRGASSPDRATRPISHLDDGGLDGRLRGLLGSSNWWDVKLRERGGHLGIANPAQSGGTTWRSRALSLTILWQLSDDPMSPCVAGQGG
jgi:hypothetical protein